MERGVFICSTAERRKFCMRLIVVIGCGIGYVKVQRKNINIFVFDTVIVLFGNVGRGQDRHGLQKEW